MKTLALACSLLAVACGDNAGHEPAPDAPPTAGRPDGVALCYSATADAHPASQALFAAFRAGDRALRADSIAALDAAAKELPDEEEIHLLLGLAHLWRLAEPLPGETEPGVQLPSAIGARDHLQRAYQLCPTDHRIAAWLGPILVRFGRTLNDQKTIDEGLAVLDKGIAAYPSFVLFSRLLIYADSPRDAPEFQQALTAVIDNTDACSQRLGDPACTNLTVPHNREGAALFLGDVLTKAGKRSDAHAAYSEALAGPDFQTWSFQPLLHERLDGLDARIALYADADATNDPAAAWAADNQCALCHTR
jgi:hypothetical protein